jgi:hypothetical protein
MQGSPPFSHSPSLTHRDACGASRCGHGPRSRARASCGSSRVWTAVGVRRVGVVSQQRQAEQGGCRQCGLMSPPTSPWESPPIPTLHRWTTYHGCTRPVGSEGARVCSGERRSSEVGQFCDCESAACPSINSVHTLHTRMRCPCRQDDDAAPQRNACSCAGLFGVSTKPPSQREIQAPLRCGLQSTASKL